MLALLLCNARRNNMVISWLTRTATVGALTTVGSRVLAARRSVNIVRRSLLAVGRRNLLRTLRKLGHKRAQVEAGHLTLYCLGERGEGRREHLLRDISWVRSPSLRTVAFGGFSRHPCSLWHQASDAGQVITPRTHNIADRLLL